MAEIAPGKPNEVIIDVEALLIRAMGLSNINQNNFVAAEKWEQVKLDEVEPYFARLGH